MRVFTKKEKTYLKYAAIIFLASLCVSLLIILYVIMLGSHGTEGIGTVDAEEVRQVYETYPTQATTVKLGYYMREYEGGLAVFREGASSPYQILDYPLYLLSDEDKLAAETGIYAADEQILRQLIEDLCS